MKLEIWLFFILRVKFMFLAMPRERKKCYASCCAIYFKMRGEGGGTLYLYTYLFHDIELQINSRQNITILYQDRTRCITLYHHLSWKGGYGRFFLHSSPIAPAAISQLLFLHQERGVFFGFFFLHEHIYFLVLYEYLPWFITKVNKYMYLFFHFSSKLVFKQMCPNLTTYTKRTTMLMLHLVNFKFPSKVDKASDILIG